MMSSDESHASQSEPETDGVSETLSEFSEFSVEDEDAWRKREYAGMNFEFVHMTNLHSFRSRFRIPEASCWQRCNDQTTRRIEDGEDTIFVHAGACSVMAHVL